MRGADVFGSNSSCPFPSSIDETDALFDLMTAMSLTAMGQSQVPQEELTLCNGLYLTLAEVRERLECQQG